MPPRMTDEEKATNITRKLDEEKRLSPQQINSLKKNPVIRDLVKKELADRGLDTVKMYADLIENAYKSALGEVKTIHAHRDGWTLPRELTEPERLGNRKLALDHLQDLDGLKLKPDNEENAPTNINFIVHPDLCLETDGRNVKIYPAPEAGGSTPDETSGENQRTNLGSPIWKK